MVRKIILSWIIWWTCNHNLGTCTDDNTTIILLNETLSWSNGQQACLDRNGTMLSEQEAKSNPEVIQQLTSRDEYWTGMHQYLSDWIGVFGWEDKKTITGIADVTTHELEWPSPGSCQEICSQYNIYAITEGSTCICIPSSAVANRLFAFKSSKVSQWTICNNSETPNTCGGYINGVEIASMYVDNTYLVYSSFSDPGGYNCMTARCAARAGKAALQTHDCDVHMSRSCENANPGTDITGQSPWKQAFEDCLNVTSIFATQLSCLNFLQGSRVALTSYWIGFKKQFYTRQDKGNNVDVAAVQRCQSCSTNGTCQYQDKSQCVAEKWVMCRVPYSEEITSTALPPETTQPETSPETATVTEATKETIVNFRDTDDEFPWLIVIVSAGGGVVLFIVILSSVLCVRMRRKKKERTEFDSTRDGNNDYEHTNDKKLMINGEGQPKNEKDVYDHLARNEGFRPEEDTYDVTGSDGQNVYNHLQLRGHVQNESESNVYDVSSSSSVPKIESESNVYNVSSQQNEDIYNHLREELPGGNLDDVYDISSCNNDKNDDIYNHLQSNATTPCPPLDEYAMYDVTSAT